MRPLVRTLKCPSLRDLRLRDGPCNTRHRIRLDVSSNKSLAQISSSSCHRGPSAEPEHSCSEAKPTDWRPTKHPTATPAETPSNGDDHNGEPSRSKDPNNYGSATRRAQRNKSPRKLPPVPVPRWFEDRNVILAEEDGGPMAIEDMHESDHATIRSKQEEAVSEAGEIGLGAQKPGGPQFDSFSDVAHEIEALMRSAVHSPQDTTATKQNGIRPHLVLSCPKEGATDPLKRIALHSRRSSGRPIDVVCLDPNAIAEIAGAYMGDSLGWKSIGLGCLSYDVAELARQNAPPKAEENNEEEDPGEEFDEDGEDEDVIGHGSSRRSSALPNRPGVIDVGVKVVAANSFADGIQGVLKSLGANHSSPSPRGFLMKGSRDPNEDEIDLKLAFLIEALLATRNHKRSLRTSASQGTQTQEGPDPKTVSETSDESSTPIESDTNANDMMILVEDYIYISQTAHGARFLDRLHEVVDTKRAEGMNTLIVGISAATGPIFPNFNALKRAENADDQAKTVVVPLTDPSPHGLFAEQRKHEIRSQNMRHLQRMLRQVAPVAGQVQELADDWDLQIDDEVAFLVDMEDAVWPIAYVERLAMMALGLRAPNGNLTVQDVESAMHLIHNSTKAKEKWWQKEHDSLMSPKSSKASKTAGQERLQKVKRKCNNYEKKLLHGVVDASSIKTTFADVHAPLETKEALKTLTTLSLVRPEAFSYGVLATDRIPGLLLYGPPGTGKTLLAKAVAKESGATVLEVSGSDVYDMYVGEGEKNVRAIFSLAKKLAPCVVFIDEADAILGTRGGSGNRNSHRELINQFLREWDGMTNSNAFIMAATNRPFDLDEASLRRLPRRLLVDLPTEKDRQEILRIHLKDEQLDANVSLSQLASDTPMYSGSDLKNLCVAAALSCVREEMDAAKAHDAAVDEGDPNAKKYEFAERRTLTSKHFSKAMEEISASINEDMRSLSAIKKFDEKYGDRRGRKKKLSSYGFKTVDEKDNKGSDAARVRNQQ